MGPPHLPELPTRFYQYDPRDTRLSLELRSVGKFVVPVARGSYDAEAADPDQKFRLKASNSQFQLGGLS